MVKRVNISKQFEYVRHFTIKMLLNYYILNLCTTAKYGRVTAVKFFILYQNSPIGTSHDSTVLLLILQIKSALIEISP